MEIAGKVKLPAPKGFWRNIVIFLAVLGPGIITANVDNDAGGIATYSVAGAHFGYALLWAVVPVVFALIVVQEMSARMGAVTGKGLADLIREHFGAKVTFYAMVALLVTNLGNTMSEFSGVAASLEIFGISKYISVPVAAFLVWFLVVKGTYKVVEKVFLVACLFYISYIVSGFLAEPAWSEVGAAMITPRAVPSPDVASGPVLQWVSTVQPSLISSAPYSLMRRVAPASSRCILTASSTRDF